MDANEHITVASQINLNIKKSLSFTYIKHVYSLKHLHFRVRVGAHAREGGGVVRKRLLWLLASQMGEEKRARFWVVNKRRCLQSAFNGLRDFIYA